MSEAPRCHLGCSQELARVSFAERALMFSCEGEQLTGILAGPSFPREPGMLIVVGGAQYRVGSHRQFVLLGRRLASQSHAVLRFDYRGMGDATGAVRSFDDIGPDIAAAIDALCEASGVKQVVLWGLCDAASAALTYWRAARDTRVRGMVLLNPWVRTEAGLARTHIKHYYWRRILDLKFWEKLLRGQVDLVGATRNFLRNFMAARGKGEAPEAGAISSFQDRMAEGIQSFPGPILVIMSGRDLTAKEFLDYTQSNSRWSGLLNRPNLVRHDIPDADHTFSSAQSRGEVEALTLDWLRRSFPSEHR
jgi:exosortase A-associated hydrolase 1